MRAELTCLSTDTLISLWGCYKTFLLTCHALLYGKKMNRQVVASLHRRDGPAPTHCGRGRDALKTPVITYDPTEC